MPGQSHPPLHHDRHRLGPIPLQEDGLARAVSALEDFAQEMG